MYHLVGIEYFYLDQYVERTKDGWTSPCKIVVENATNTVFHGLARDGTLALVSSSLYDEVGLTEKTENGWSSPQYFTPKIPVPNSPLISEDGNVVVYSGSNDRKEPTIYFYFREGDSTKLEP